MGTTTDCLKKSEQPPPHPENEPGRRILIKKSISVPLSGLPGIIAGERTVTQFSNLMNGRLRYGLDTAVAAGGGDGTNETRKWVCS